jgi:hypothetical protein
MLTGSNPVIDWLLEANGPSVRLRTLKELLECEDSHPQVVQARDEVLQSAPVRKLLEQMHPGGFWLQKNPRTGAVVGDGVVYGSFATTHFCLAYLAELGLDRSCLPLAAAAERYLNLQQPDGDWFRHFSCLIGYNIHTFVRLGYREDARLKRAVELLLDTPRPDGGFLCDFHEKPRKIKPVKSCIRGSVKALWGFAELPETWEHPRVKQLVAYFLNHGGIFQSAHPTLPVNRDVLLPSFPVIWRANTWEVLYALSRMGYGGDERLERAWEVLEKSAGPGGLYRMDWTPEQCPWKVGKRGEANAWLTLYALLARKYQKQSPEIRI